MWTTSYSHDEGLELVALLRLLGYRARLVRISALRTAVGQVTGGQWSRPASARGLRPHAKLVSYQPVIGVIVVPNRDECAIQPFPR